MQNLFQTALIVFRTILLQIQHYLVIHSIILFIILIYSHLSSNNLSELSQSHPTTDQSHPTSAQSHLTTAQSHPITASVNMSLSTGKADPIIS